MSIDTAKTNDEPGQGDDVPCVKCGAAALDTGLECTECGFDNYEAVTGHHFAELYFDPDGMGLSES